MIYIPIPNEDSRAAVAMVNSRIKTPPTEEGETMSIVMVFRHDNSDLEFRLEPLNVPDTVTMNNVQAWLVERAYSHLNDVYTVVEVSDTVTYKVKQLPPLIPLPEYYVEKMPEFSIFNHEENGRG